MSQEDIFDRVKKIVIEQLSVEDRDRVVPSTNLMNDLKADSLDTVELRMALEEEFGGEISDEEAEELLTNWHITIQDIADYISKRISEKG